MLLLIESQSSQKFIISFDPSLCPNKLKSKLSMMDLPLNMLILLSLFLFVWLNFIFFFPFVHRAKKGSLDLLHKQICSLTSIFLSWKLHCSKIKLVVIQFLVDLQLFLLWAFSVWVFIWSFQIKYIALMCSSNWTF